LFKKEVNSKIEEKLVDIEAGVEGNVKFSSPINLKINGKFDGKLETKGTLIMGENADVKAKIIKGENISIQGKVEGDIICNRLELSPSARVIGNIKVSTLVINEGAVLKGDCQMPVDEKVRHKESAYKKKIKEKSPEEVKKEKA
jgi:cytoskeletal protein CcmA (bactofilin family)